MCTVRDVLSYGVFCLSNLGLYGINSLSLCSSLIMYSHFFLLFDVYFVIVKKGLMVFSLSLSLSLSRVCILHFWFMPSHALIWLLRTGLLVWRWVE